MERMALMAPLPPVAGTEATVAMDMTTPRDTVDLAAREAMAARSAMVEMAEMEEAA